MARNYTAEANAMQKVEWPTVWNGSPTTRLKPNREKVLEPAWLGRLLAYPS